MEYNNESLSDFLSYILYDPNAQSIRQSLNIDTAASDKVTDPMLYGTIEPLRVEPIDEPITAEIKPIEIPGTTPTEQYTQFSKVDDLNVEINPIHVASPLDVDDDEYDAKYIINDEPRDTENQDLWGTPFINMNKLVESGLYAKLAEFEIKPGSNFMNGEYTSPLSKAKQKLVTAGFDAINMAKNVAIAQGLHAVTDTYIGDAVTTGLAEYSYLSNRVSALPGLKNMLFDNIKAGGEMIYQLGREAAEATIKKTTSYLKFKIDDLQTLPDMAYITSKAMPIYATYLLDSKTIMQLLGTTPKKECKRKLENKKVSKFKKITHDIAYTANTITKKVNQYVSYIDNYIGYVSYYIDFGPEWVCDKIDTYCFIAFEKSAYYIGQQHQKINQWKWDTINTMITNVAIEMAEETNQMLINEAVRQQQKLSGKESKIRTKAKSMITVQLLKLKAMLGQ